MPDIMPIDRNQGAAIIEKLGDIASAIVSKGDMELLEWDDEHGYYTNRSISALLSRHRDGLAYGVSIPKGSATACTKTGANAGIASPTPGWLGSPAIDPYVGKGPFFMLVVNGYVEIDGTTRVTAIEGDGNFKKDGTNGNVWVLTPVLYWLFAESGANAVELSVSDTKLSGMEAQPQAYLPDGTLRPYMLYAKYIGSNDGSGKMVSVSGAKAWNRSVSHNSLITQAATATTGYSGKSYADDWYVKAMFLLKYATKNSHGVFAGCTSYSYQYAPAVAETGVKRVILTNAQAANLVVGSAMMLGTHTSDSTDRAQSYNYDVFDGANITSIETYDSDNKAVYFDVPATFDVATTYLLSTAPWNPGCLDAVVGDGALSQAGLLNGKEPFVIQGIECSMGVTEIIGDLILKSDGSTGWKVFVNYDSKNEATGVTADYTDTGKALPSGESAAWQYPLYPTNGGGMLFGIGTGGSTSAGMCDGEYVEATATTGEREWLSVGNLNSGSTAGLWYVSGVSGLTNASWYIGSRLSATGRGRAAA